MASNSLAAISAFIEGAPPGELSDVVNDIKALTPNDGSLLDAARPAFEQYNEEQLTSVKLPGKERSVLVSQYNRLGDGRYYDAESQCSWAFDHVSQKASDIQPHTVETENEDLITSLHRTLSLHAQEHYSTSTLSILPPPFPPPSPSSQGSIHILLATSKYSPSNFWNGRLRTIYLYNPTSSTLSGTLVCDVHYYEDGNVRLTTHKAIPETKIHGGGAGDVVKEIAGIEKKWQEELNRGFNFLSEGEFKSLRRQLPVTRQKVEWEKVGSYRAGREVGGARR